MKFTEEMINEDEKRWHARDVVTELGYCGNYMRDRKDMKNTDIRYYAYIMRKAYNMLKEQEAVKPIPPTEESDLWRCGNCNHELFRCTHQRYCEMCGRKVKWNDT